MKFLLTVTINIAILIFSRLIGGEPPPHDDSLVQALQKEGIGEYAFSTVRCRLKWFRVDDDEKSIALSEKESPMPNDLMLNCVRHYGTGAVLYYQNGDVFGRYSLIQVPCSPGVQTIAKLNTKVAACLSLGQPYVRWQNNLVWGYIVGSKDGHFAVMIVRIFYDDNGKANTKWIAIGEFAEPVSHPAPPLTPSPAHPRE